MIKVNTLTHIIESTDVIQYDYNDIIFTVQKLKKTLNQVPLYEIKFNNIDYHEMLIGGIGGTSLREKRTTVQSYNVGGTLEYIFRLIENYERY